ncbi:hypothetical protein PAPYR_5886 [Paratrimastix pyriformis]|uniref:Uncharacterized protein n=1 Tax=Paratrimastix pyriformis TaxID=342808 RepID=A0ABQ8UJE3_9EUKA|nr:hypothetical protein PAPYR_5886 [Paratrimastix pyriformis]
MRKIRPMSEELRREVEMGAQSAPRTRHSPDTEEKEEKNRETEPTPKPSELSEPAPKRATAPTTAPAPPLRADDEWAKVSHCEKNCEVPDPAPFRSLGGADPRFGLSPMTSIQMLRLSHEIRAAVLGSALDNSTPSVPLEAPTAMQGSRHSVSGQPRHFPFAYGPLANCIAWVEDCAGHQPLAKLGLPVGPMFDALLGA